MGKSFVMGQKIAALFLFSVILVGCAPLKPYTLYLSPPPDYYSQNKINPITGVEPFKDNIVPIFYATNRKAANPQNKLQRFYDNSGGMELVIGKAQVQFGTKNTRWEDLEKYIVGERPKSAYPLQVLGIEEFGFLNFALPFFDENRHKDGSSGPDQRLIHEINDVLAKSKRKDITVFVHGFKVPFDDPVLISAQLWYYLGFDGVVMGFSWPSSQSTFGYLNDIAKTQIASRQLLYFLRFLSMHTDVERINVVAHSAGTRVLGRTLADMSLLCGMDDQRQENIKTLKLGKIVLASGDASKFDIGIYLEYGILDLSSKLIIYTSQQDKALSFSDWLWNEERVGRLELDPKKMKPAVLKFLKTHANLEIVDATDTPNSKLFYGHVYFLGSPWVSSDLIMALTLKLGPEERGLVKDENGLVWKFPKNYKPASVLGKLRFMERR
jgi:esterase/lipase superfamily enzyme